jgi:hypothetical protein
MAYNAAFFETHEAYFLELKERDGEKSALDAMTRVMKRNLGKAYIDMGFKKGDPKEFARVVGERDASVGLDVRFPVVTENKIVYQFHTDPFPGLRGHVEPEKLDATYMQFKVDFLLGEGWSYRTTKHLWKDHDYTEHIIEKK